MQTEEKKIIKYLCRIVCFWNQSLYFPHKITFALPRLPFFCPFFLPRAGAFFFVALLEAWSPPSAGLGPVSPLFPEGHAWTKKTVLLEYIYLYRAVLVHVCNYCTVISTTYYCILIFTNHWICFCLRHKTAKETVPDRCCPHLFYCHCCSHLSPGCYSNPSELSATCQSEIENQTICNVEWYCIWTLLCCFEVKLATYLANVTFFPFQTLLK